MSLNDIITKLILVLCMMYENDTIKISNIQTTYKHTHHKFLNEIFITRVYISLHFLFQTLEFGLQQRFRWTTRPLADKWAVS